MKGQCKACQYFLREGETSGFCRRYPPGWLPTMSGDGKEAVLWTFPKVHEDACCGEFYRILD